MASLRPPLLAFLARGMRRHDAEDATQETLIRIATTVDRIDPERAREYLLTVARNELRRAGRRCAIEGRRAASIDLADYVESEIRSEHAVEYHDLVGAIRRWSRTVRPRAEGDVVLGVLSGLSSAEIAKRLALTPETVRRRLREARRHLRQELRPFADLLGTFEQRTRTASRLVREERVYPSASLTARAALGGRAAHWHTNTVRPSQVASARDLPGSASRADNRVIDPYWRIRVSLNCRVL